MTKKKLTYKQQLFVDAYDGNASEAARIAGYQGKNPDRIGSENLRKPAIAEAIAKRDAKPRAGIIASRQDRQKFWSDTMVGDKLDLKDRLRASELLGKSEADFIDKQITLNTFTMADFVKAAAKSPQDAPGSTITPEGSQ